MLLAKGLSILFSLFAGLESAKGALYHFVCGKGKDRIFPYLKEIKGYVLEGHIWHLLSDVFVFETAFLLQPEHLDECLREGRSSWMADLFYTVGGFTINCSLQEEGILFELEDYYDWHSGSLWWVPEFIVKRLPKWLLNQLPKLGFKSFEDSFYIEENLLSSFGQSYWHKGSFLITYDEIGAYLYCSLERNRRRATFE